MTAQTILYYDSETFGHLPLSLGVYKYAETSELLTAQYAVNDGPVTLIDWVHGQRDRYLDDLLQSPDVTIVAHNAQFDRVLMGMADNASPAMRVAARQITRWRCTQVRGMCHGLPGGLGVLSQLYNLGTNAKALDGKSLIHLFCKPLPKNNKLRRATAATHPDEWRRFLDYAKQDIPPTRELFKRLPDWNMPEGGSELALYHLDQKINDRGFLLDMALVDGAMQAVASRQHELDDETLMLTGEELSTTRRRDALITYMLAEFGVDLPDLKMSTLEKRVNDEELPEIARRLIRIRLSASSASVSKYKRAKSAVCRDRRIRGSQAYSGARRTRRWAGRILQPHNFMRPDKNWPIDADIEALRAGIGNLVLPNPIRSAANALRGIIIASPGRKLVWGDLSSVEARGTAWLSAEQWQLDAYKNGEDIYRINYARSFGGVAAQVTDTQRQISKVVSLAASYGGNVGALLSMAMNYKIEPAQLIAMARANAPPALVDEGREFYDWCARSDVTTYGLTRDDFAVLNAVIRGWRYANPLITRMPKLLNAACVDAINYPDTWFPAGPKLWTRCDGGWLRILLPSGNWLCYPEPRADGARVSYMGQNAYNFRWSRIYPAPGLWLENSAQGLTRDFMAHNMPAIDAAGFEIVLMVHDEVVTDAPDNGQYTAGNLVSLMSRRPPYALDFPLTADGVESYRYRKAA